MNEEGRPRGFAHVEFDSPQAAMKAVQELNGVALDGRELRLDISAGRGGQGGRGGRGGDRGGMRGGRGGRGGGFRGGRGGFRGGFDNSIKAANKGTIVQGQGKKTTF